jgi:aspartate aminotransferase-like enzyme
MEGAVVNTLCPGDQALVIQGGKFGERWANICRAYGGETPDHPGGMGEKPRSRAD